MKLNPDCIRDMLLTIEEKVDNDIILISSTNYVNYELLKPYTFNEVLYHAAQIDLAGMTSGMDRGTNQAFMVAMLSPYGHEFLEDIRSEANWSKTKETAKNVGSFSLRTLVNIAGQIVSALVSSQFQ